MNRLDKWIRARVSGVKYVVGEFAEVDFNTFKEETAKNGYMKISNVNTENTIFANSEIAVMSRVWHDLIHILLDEDFSLKGEATVAFYQAAELPEDWHEERALLLTDIIGQRLYYTKNKQFVGNQKEFVDNLQLNGVI